MIRYGGWINRECKDDFLQDIIDADLVLTQTAWAPTSIFYIVYFVDRKDETYFRLKYPGLKKEIDNAQL